MRRLSFIQCPLILATLVIIISGGCTGKSQPTRFYMLSSTAKQDTVIAGNKAVENAAIGLGPIKVADYLDQSRIIVRAGDNSIIKAEFDQWSGSFKDNLTNILAENIGYLVPTDRIVTYPWRSYMSIDYQVPVDIVRFDGQLEKEVNLVARWSVLDGDRKILQAIKRTDISEPVSAGGYEGLVAAQSRALGRLSQEISLAIEAVNQARRVDR